MTRDGERGCAGRRGRGKELAALARPASRVLWRGAPCSSDAAGARRAGPRARRAGPSGPDGGYYSKGNAKIRVYLEIKARSPVGDAYDHLNPLSRPGILRLPSARERDRRRKLAPAGGRSMHAHARARAARRGARRAVRAAGVGARGGVPHGARGARGERRGRERGLEGGIGLVGWTGAERGTRGGARAGARARALAPHSSFPSTPRVRWRGGAVGRAPPPSWPPAPPSPRPRAHARGGETNRTRRATVERPFARHGAAGRGCSGRGR